MLRISDQYCARDDRITLDNHKEFFKIAVLLPLESQESITRALF